MGDSRPLVLHVLHHLVTGGMENGLVNLINHLPESSWRHHVLCIEDFSRFRERIRSPDVEVVALRRSSIGTWRLRRAIFDACRRWRPAIVHTRALSGLDALLPARLAGGAALLHSEHGWNVDDLGGTDRRAALLRRVHAPLVDRFLTVSRDLQRYLELQVRIAPGRIVQIYNGVDTARFRPLGAARRASLPESLRDGRLLIVGTAGRLQRVKDQATLLRAVALLRSRSSELRDRLRVVLIGAGPLAEELTALAGELGLDECAWFAGSVDGVERLVAGLDLFVLPSLMEGTSNTLLEGMACGVPVLATPVGGNLELVRDGVVGKFFGVGDIEGLASSIAATLGSPDDLRRMATQARDWVLRQFSLDVMMQRYGELYGSLAEISRRRRSGD